MSASAKKLTHLSRKDRSQMGSTGHRTQDLLKRPSRYLDIIRQADHYDDFLRHYSKCILHLFNFHPKVAWKILLFSNKGACSTLAYTVILESLFC